MIYSLTSWSDSSEESAQTSLYVLLSDDAPPITRVRNLVITAGP